MRIYLDACALNRLSDDQSQPRVFAESEAVEQILRMVSGGRVEWSASRALHRELSRNPNHEKRHDALALLSHAGPLLEADAAIAHRANDLMSLGYGAFDALHLAFAEADYADVLITTDDRFQKRRLAVLEILRYWKSFSSRYESGKLDRGGAEWLH